MITSKFGVPCFVITQKEPDILYSIRNKLGFGETKYDKSANCYRYVVRDLTSIIKLIFIFKGNLFLDHRINQLNNWILAIKQRQVIPSQQFSELEYKIWVQELLLLNTADSISRVNISLKDSWLSGFTDAEGCFNVNIIKRQSNKLGYRTKLRFILDQKDCSKML